MTRLYSAIMVILFSDDHSPSSVQEVGVDEFPEFLGAQATSFALSPLSSSAVCIGGRCDGQRYRGQASDDDLRYYR